MGDAVTDMGWGGITRATIGFGHNRGLAPPTTTTTEQLGATEELCGAGVREWGICYNDHMLSQQDGLASMKNEL